MATRIEPRQLTILRVGSLLWAGVGLAVAMASLRQVNPDARVAVLAVSLLGPGCAVAAAECLGQRHVRTGGLLLLISVVTPTYFAWELNLPALVTGLVLLVHPTVARSGPAKAA